MEQKYNFFEIEKKLSDKWKNEDVYKYDVHNKENKKNFIIDTPPPTISGVLHMGHVFSYCHADFIARFQRIMGKNVFYPIGFDDNGLPTERLVEKESKIKAFDMNRADFINMCQDISERFKKDFRDLFISLGFSFDWSLEYSTSSDLCKKISQTSFVELCNTNNNNNIPRAYLAEEPCYWDCIDKTSIAQAEIVEQEVSSKMHYIAFSLIDPSGKKVDDITIATTRPELMHACMAVFFNPEDIRYKQFIPSGESFYSAITACGTRVPLIPNTKVIPEKGTGVVMFCTFGDELDLEWYKNSHKIGNLEISFVGHPQVVRQDGHIIPLTEEEYHISADPIIVDLGVKYSAIAKNPCWYVYEPDTFKQYMEVVGGFFVNKARKNVEEFFISKNFIKKTDEIKHTVKCAERSGALLEIIPSLQWYISFPDKDILLSYVEKCIWHPDNMKTRIQNWINGLRHEWCISRQRYHGVPIPVWYIYLPDSYFSQNNKKEAGDYRCFVNKDKRSNFIVFVASYDDLPISPTESVPKGMQIVKNDKNSGFIEVVCVNDVYAKDGDIYAFFDKESTVTHSLDKIEHRGMIMSKIAKKNDIVFPMGSKIILYPEMSVMDTWATSSLTPQINARRLNNNHIFDDNFSNDIFPADLRPQAHEIIRTWAFYTIVKSIFHNNSIPWKNLLISGWCLAKDKTKMSKSKGNVIEPRKLLNEKGADVVRYWAAYARSGVDTVVSDDVMNAGHRLVNKIWNAGKFISLHLTSSLKDSLQDKITQNKINQIMDLWIISRMIFVCRQYKEYFENFDYWSARSVAEEFFWNDFCDNYLEFIKVRIYADSNNEFSEEEKQSAVYAVSYCFRTILTFFAPFLPYVTDEVYRSLFQPNTSIHSTNDWLNYNNIDIAENAVSLGNACVEILSCVRKIKTEKNVSIKKACNLFIYPCNNNSVNVVDILDLRNATNAVEIYWELDKKNRNYTQCDNYMLDVDILL